jgi:hypothetical protein
MINKDIEKIHMDFTYHYLGDNMYVFNCKKSNGKYANFFAMGKDHWDAYKNIEESGLLNE